jgi:chromate transporter
VLTAVTPVFFRLKSSPVFLRAVQGILASFVGLLFFVTVKFGMAVPWDAVRILIGISAFFALVRKVDILYVVLAGSVISLIVL